SGLDITASGAGLGPSDQASFYRKKIPVVAFFSGLHKEYHTPRDSAGRINSARAVDVLAVADSILATLWSDPERIAYKPLGRGAGRRAMEAYAEAYIGIVPELLSERAGCEVAEVAPGGPAEKAGLKAGDVIVAWDGQDIESVAELMVAVHGGKPGQEVALKVRRGRKTLEIEVVLTKRKGG
ncbi:hypothetical protein LCGC14_2222050, partial [marine sediment metagenome]